MPVATAIRVQMSWASVAPNSASSRAPSFNQTSPGAYPASGWANYDRVISDARARGLKVLLTLTGPAPDWATPKHDGLTRPDPAAFGKFATAAGRRYRRQISWWSIWNEPNLGKLLKPLYGTGHPRPIKSAAIYRRLYMRAYAGLRAAAVRRPILLGELSPRASSGVDLAAQSDFRSLAEYMAWSNPRVKSFAQYLLRDDPTVDGATGRFESGLFLYKGDKPKPALTSFRIPLVVRRTKSPTRVCLWGYVRPAHGRSGTVAIQYRDGSHGSWRRLANQHYRGNGYWQRTVATRKERVWRIVWDAPDGTTYTGPATMAR